MSTNFEYSLGKYYTLVNKSTGAKRGQHSEAFG